MLPQSAQSLMGKRISSDIHRKRGARFPTEFRYKRVPCSVISRRCPRMSRLSKVVRTLGRLVSRRPLRTSPGSKTPLFLHVGPHKTGTTAIQLFCERNRNELAKAGFWYPKAGLASGQHMVLPGCYISHHPHIPESLLGGSPEKIVADIAAEVPRGLTPVMSSEVYWELF